MIQLYYSRQAAGQLFVSKTLFRSVEAHRYFTQVCCKHLRRKLETLGSDLNPHIHCLTFRGICRALRNNVLKQNNNLHYK